MFTSIGNVLGPIVGGFLFDMNLDYPYYFSAVFLMIGFAFALAWKSPARLRA
jgi:DHA1 family multidrug resistance protein-like MFS transporter